MSTVTRLWLLVPALAGEELSLPSPLELSAIVAGPAAAGQGRALAAARGCVVHLDAELELGPGVGAALGKWAREFAGEQCALICSSAALERAVGDALGMGEGQRLALRPGGCATLDWPLDADTRPALVGFDLDWTPVFLPTGRPKFPGGPGVASSGRS